MARTFYPLQSGAVLSGVHAAGVERALALAAGAGTQARNQAAGSTSQAWLWTTEAGEPGDADWPNGIYSFRMDITAAGGSLSFGVRTINGVAGHFGRVNSGLSADLGTVEQAEAAFAGTGIHTATASWNPAAGATTDRLEVLVVVANSHMMNTETLEISVADSRLDGPWVVVSGVEGAIAQTLAALQQLAAGEGAVEASAAQSLPALTQSAAGNVASPGIEGSIGQQLGALGQSAAGEAAASATAGQTLPALGQSVQATATVEGRIAGPTFDDPAVAFDDPATAFDEGGGQTLPALTQAAAGTVAGAAVEGSIAQQLPALGQAVVGTVASVTVQGSLSQTLAALQQSLGGEARVEATASQGLPGLIQGVSGEAEAEATAAQQLPALSQALAGEATIDGSVTQTLPALDQDVVGAVDIPGVHGPIRQTLPALGQSADGALTVETSSGSQQLPALGQDIDAGATATATAAQPLPALGQALEADVAPAPSAQLAQPLPALSQAAAGESSITGGLEQGIPALTQAVLMAPAESYFLPPVRLSRPPRSRWREFGVRSDAHAPIVDFLRGETVEIGGRTYQGGYWHGPLTPAQVAAIQAAGYADRIAAVKEGEPFPILDDDGNLVTT